jgi:glycogen debranching enzyme
MRPTRLPDGWGSPKEWDEARYALPEVNALWISALSSIKGITNGSAAEIIDRSLEELKASFKSTFWNGSTVANVVDTVSRRRDWTPTSMGAVSMAVASRLFTDEEVEAALSSWKIANRRLMTLGKDALPFGIAITPSKEPYLGDWQYHRSVVWPRDTPYLINILQRLGREEDVNAILVNNLDHMVSEGALLYSSEIFGFAAGVEAGPQGQRAAEGSLIPLKNPAQYWSHWCDPYIGRFVEVR